ncbi:MAG: hypothetical protein Q4D81_03345, partial [Eubacteriales bacterium]|nr:hypothetical protein [Eubacteriales bacterium]
RKTGARKGDDSRADTGTQDADPARKTGARKGDDSRADTGTQDADPARKTGARKGDDSRADTGTQAADPCSGTDAAGRLSIHAKFDGEIQLCEDKETKRVFRCGRRGVCAAALSGDGRLAALGFYDGHLRLMESGNGTLRWEVSSGSMITRVCFDPAGALLLAGCAGGAIHVYRLADGRRLHLLAGHSAPVTSFDFSSGGLLLRTGSEDGEFRLWQLDYEYTLS